MDGRLRNPYLEKTSVRKRVILYASFMTKKCGASTTTRAKKKMQV
jgi:hypothetical protein